MPLSPDQKATLQLLLERGQSYADLSSLLGVDEAEVRERARSALRELAGGDPDRNVGLTDYLLGQADPIGRADAVRHLREDPDDYRLASDLLEELREAVPAAELPRLPGEPRSGRFLRRAPAAADRGPEPDTAAPARRLTSLSGPQARLLVIVGSAAVLLVAVVLGITGAFGGDDGGDGDSTTTATDTTAATDASGQEITRVKLTPPGNGDAKGDAVFGLATNDQAYVDLTISGLDPAPNDQTYVIWLLLDKGQGYPLAPIGVSEDGAFHDRFPIPSAVLALVTRVRFVDVSIAPNDVLASLIQKAQEQTQKQSAQITDLILQKPGRTVLEGEIPPAEQQPSG
jgi:hypothetical protein